MVRLSIVFIMIFLTGCSSHRIHQWEDVSQDCTYISFVNKTTPFRLTSQVGGEHTSFIKVLGFEGEMFEVAHHSLAGEVMVGISGQGIEIVDPGRTGTGKETVLVVDRESIFTVDLSAHPYGEYELTITRLPLTVTRKIQGLY